MSDHSISIVPQLSSFPGREKKAAEILEWLVSNDIVKRVVEQGFYKEIKY